MELNREQTIEALECCAELKPCKMCPLSDYSYDDAGCKHKCMTDALAIYRELTEENKQKDETIAGLIGTIKDAYGSAVRKMQERLHWKVQWARNDHCDMDVVDICDIDQIAQDMLEEG